MAKRNIIVIGASAGGLDAVSRILKGLPEELAAAIFIVIHISPDGPGLLSGILHRLSTLPVTTAQDHERIVSGQVYVAPPDRHLLLAHHEVRVMQGPREHGFRPAVDPLFRSAAAHHGRRAIGVILSGSLGDGAHGLVAIKRAGGIAIVQDPKEAMVSQMPATALRQTDVDYVLPSSQMSAVLAELTMTGIPKTKTGRHPSREPGPEEPGADALETGTLPWPPSPFTCPDCGGTLWELQSDKLVRYRCHVGHGFNADSLMAAQSGKLEETLWSALRAIEESLEMRRRMADRARQRDLRAMLPEFERQIKDLSCRADALRALLVGGESVPRGKSARKKR